MLNKILGTVFLLASWGIYTIERLAFPSKWVSIFVPIFAILGLFLLIMGVFQSGKKN
jgi:hypothetical protein